MRLVFPVKDHELYSQKSFGNLEICVFGIKKSINYQIKFTLNLFNSY